MDDNVEQSYVGRIKPLTFCWFFLMRPRFRFFVTESLKYALRYHGRHGGYGSSDVTLLRSLNEFDKIWK